MNYSFPLSFNWCEWSREQRVSPCSYHGKVDKGGIESGQKQLPMQICCPWLWSQGFLYFSLLNKSLNFPWLVCIWQSTSLFRIELLLLCPTEEMPCTMPCGPPFPRHRFDGVLGCFQWCHSSSRKCFEMHVRVTPESALIYFSSESCPYLSVLLKSVNFWTHFTTDHDKPQFRTSISFNIVSLTGTDMKQ